MFTIIASKKLNELTREGEQTILLSSLGGRKKMNRSEGMIFGPNSVLSTSEIIISYSYHMKNFDS